MGIGDQSIPFLAEKDLPLNVRSGNAMSDKEEEKLRKKMLDEEKKKASSSSSSSTSTSSSSSTTPVSTDPKKPKTTSQPSNPWARKSNESSSQSPQVSSQNPGNQSQPPRSTNTDQVSSGNSLWNEEKISILTTQMGCNRNQAIQALTLCGGNTEFAASWLFSNINNM